MTGEINYAAKLTRRARLHHGQRWRALLVLCLGVLMTTLDGTVVNIALPSIHDDLRFADTTLVWVVNAYSLTLGGSLILSGQLGDRYGHRRLYMLGIMVFTLASLACGSVESRALLIAARALQGFGGAAVMAVALALIMGLFSDVAERAKAIGIYSFVTVGGGSLGLILGGALTSILNWHWIFLINLPIGVAVWCLSFLLLPARHTRHAPPPLRPLDIFTARGFCIANLVGMLWSAAGHVWFFVSALYMQLILGYIPLQVGLAFLPANLLTAVFAFGLSARLVTRFGLNGPLAVGLALIAIGLALLSRADVDTTPISGILPAMILIGLGGGLAYNPLVLAVMGDIEAGHSGLASGTFNMLCLLGGAVGLAVITRIAALHSSELQSNGVATSLALTAGYRTAFLLGAICAGSGAALGAIALHSRTA